MTKNSKTGFKLVIPLLFALLLTLLLSGCRSVERVSVDMSPEGTALHVEASEIEVVDDGADVHESAQPGEAVSTPEKVVYHKERVSPSIGVQEIVQTDKWVIVRTAEKDYEFHSAVEGEKQRIVPGEDSLHSYVSGSPVVKDTTIVMKKWKPIWQSPWILLALLTLSAAGILLYRVMPKRFF